MNKIITIFFFIFVTFFPELSLADDRYGMDLNIAFQNSKSDYKSLSMGDGTSKFGDTNGYKFSSSFIVNDGYIFGNSGYLTASYEKMKGKTLLNNNSLSTSKEESGLLLDERYLTKNNIFFVGAGIKYLTFDISSLNSLSYHSVYLGTKIGYTHFFDYTYGLGFLIDGYYSVYNKVESSSKNMNSSHSYLYSFDIPIIFKLNSSFNIEVHNKFNSCFFGKTNSVQNLKYSSFKINSFISSINLRLIF